jgi:uncharacterized membrane protein YfcA
MQSAIVLCLLLACSVYANGTLGSHCGDSYGCDNGLICLSDNSTCSYCQLDDECGTLRICRRQHETEALELETQTKCEHKSLLYPLTWQDLLLSVFMFCSAALASGGGTGGGGLYVPILMIVGLFLPKEAIPLSKATAFGGAIANVIQLTKEKHPASPASPLIDYRVCAAMEPMTLLGSILGVLLNVALPNWLILVLLTLLLTLTAYLSFKKGIAVWKTESPLLGHSHEKDNDASHPSLLISVSSDGSVDHDGKEEGVTETSQLVEMVPTSSDNDNDNEDEDANGNGNENDSSTPILSGRNRKKHGGLTDSGANSQGGDNDEEEDLLVEVEHLGRRDSVSPSLSDTLEELGANMLNRGNSHGSGHSPSLSPKDERDTRSTGLESMTVPVNEEEIESNRQALRDCWELRALQLLSLSKTPLKSGTSTSAPWWTLLCLVSVWLIVLGLSFMRGGHGAPSIFGFACGSIPWWLVTFATVPPCILASYYASLRLYCENRCLGLMIAAGDRPASSSPVFDWSLRRMVTLPLISVVTGTAAGLLGIGGGMVSGPLLLQVGMHPQASAASSSFMILFTASSTTLQFFVLGMLPADYGLWLGLLGFASSALGQTLVKAAVKKTGRASLVIFLIASIIAVSTVLLFFIGAANVYHDVVNQQHLLPQWPCA